MPRPHRKLPSTAIAIENDLRGTLPNFGLKIGTVGTMTFGGRIRELVENLPDLALPIFPCPTFPNLLQGTNPQLADCVANGIRDLT